MAQGLVIGEKTGKGIRILRVYKLLPTKDTKIVTMLTLDFVFFEFYVGTVNDATMKL